MLSNTLLEFKIHDSIKRKGDNMYKQIPWTLNEIKIKKKKKSQPLRAKKRKNTSYKKYKNKDKCFTLFGWKIIIKN